MGMSLIGLSEMAAGTYTIWTLAWDGETLFTTKSYDEQIKDWEHAFY